MLVHAPLVLLFLFISSFFLLRFYTIGMERRNCDSSHLPRLTTKFVKTFWQTKEDVIDTPKLDILALSYWHFFFLILLDRKATEKIDVETLSFIIIIIIIILFFFLLALCETR